MAQCWICGSQANSGEHRIKKSDLKGTMNGEINQETPIYHRANGVKKRPIRSLKAEALKFDKNICSTCNGSLTQQHDYAWENFAKYLRGRSFATGEEIELNSIFDSDIKSNLINVHLFFVKILGCHAVESGLSLDLTSLANSITTNNICPNVFIKVRNSDNGKTDSYCAVSDIEVSRDTSNNILYAHMYYTVGKYTVDIVYSEVPSEIDLIDYFQPSDSLTKIIMGNVEYQQGYQSNSTS